MHFRTLSVALPALLLLVGVGVSALEAGAPVEELVRRLEETVPEVLGRYQVPGVSVAIISGGRTLWTGAWGTVQPDTLFETGSISKSVTAWGVLRLVQDGLLDLDAPVQGTMRRWRIPPSEYDASGVTARRLLSHTAGVVNYVGAELPPGAALPSLEWILSGRAVFPRPVHLVHEPGAGFLYSNCGYTILELLIEEASGMEFAGYMRERVLEPLGMKASSFDHAAIPPGRKATGHRADGEPVATGPTALRAAGGLVSTASDIARFLARGFGTGAEPLYTPVTEPQGLLGLAAEGYGLGCFVETLPGGQVAVSHGGENPGFISQYYYLPATGEGIVVLQNSDRGLQLVAALVSEWALWANIGLPEMARNVDRAAGALANSGIVLASATGVLLFLFLFQLMEKERRWKPLKAPRTGRLVPLRLLLCVPIAAAPYFCWKFAVPLFYELVPSSVILPAVSLTSLGIVLALIVVFPRERTARR